MSAPWLRIEEDRDVHDDERYSAVLRAQFVFPKLTYTRTLDTVVTGPSIAETMSLANVWAKEAGLNPLVWDSERDPEDGKTYVVSRLRWSNLRRDRSRLSTGNADGDWPHP